MDNVGLFFSCGNQRCSHWYYVGQHAGVIKLRFLVYLYSALALVTFIYTEIYPPRYQLIDPAADGSNAKLGRLGKEYFAIICNPTLHRKSSNAL